MTVPQRISDIVNLPTSEKKLLKEQIEVGIKDGLITTFTIKPEKTKSGSVDKNLIRRVQEGVPNADKSATLRLDANHSYLIMAESKNETWIQTLDWLIDKGGRRVFIALDDLNSNAQLSNRINEITKDKSCKVFLMPITNKPNADSVTKMIVEANKVVPLEAVFAVSTEPKIISHLDLALQKAKSYAHLISLFSGGLDHCEARRSSGYSATVIQSEDKIMNVLPVLNELQMILSRNSNSNIPTLLDVLKESPASDVTMKVPALNKYLPKSMRMLEEFGEDISNSLQFSEVTSLSPKFQYTKGINPIFVIPSIHKNHMQVVVEKLMYPVFCATVSQYTGSVKQMALQLYKSLITIQPTGSVTLIGETWNAILAIELSLLVRENDRQYKLFLIEGNPNFWLDYTKKMSLNGTMDFDDRLMHELFGDSYQIFRKTVAQKEMSFQNKVENYLSQFDMEDQAIKNVTMSVTITREQLMRISQYEDVDRILYHTTIFLEHSLVTNYPLKLAVTSDIKKINETTYEEFIRNPTIAYTINKTAAFGWWEDHTKA